LPKNDRSQGILKQRRLSKQVVHSGEAPDKQKNHALAFDLYCYCCQTPFGCEKFVFNSSQKYCVVFVKVDAANLPSGIYFHQLKADNFVKTKKLILLK
jgi:hypothetical protein